MTTARLQAAGRVCCGPRLARRPHPDAIPLLLELRAGDRDRLRLARIRRVPVERLERELPVGRALRLREPEEAGLLRLLLDALAALALLTRRLLRVERQARGGDVDLRDGDL